ncbi:MAG: hypothetical protein COA66_07870 [Arcobacter sp.]|nr:MAG: hypothetical protein COA66_07870 [Arcobacter sp.]
MKYTTINLDKEYLSIEETSIFTDTSVGSLAVARSLKKGFPFCKRGRKILYKKSDLIEMIESGRVNIEKGE